MKISDLTLADLGYAMSQLSKKMSRLQERTPENTKDWEELAFKRGCLGSEVERRLDSIEYPNPKKLKQ